MEPHAKLNVLKQLNVKSIAAAAASRPDDVEFVARIGRIVNTSGIEILAVVSPTVANGVNGAVPQSIFFSFLL